ncbi:MAG TPA: HAD-IA family hydrolase [Candidatus Saccharimonadales bacterium]
MINGGVSDLEKVLGKRIQSFRKAAGLTQQQLCNKASISYSTLTKIERGAIKSPSIFTVEAIASAIGTSLDELLGSDREADLSRQLRTTQGGISFVYFDVNGCLVRFAQRAFTKIAEDYEVPTDVVETAFWHYNDEVCRGSLSMGEFNKKLAEKIGIDSLSYQSYYLEAVESVPGTLELVQWAFKHYKVGLLTNIMPGLLSELIRSGKVPDLKYDAVIDSSAVGHIKPEGEIYKIAATKAGVSPHEILLIDDTRAFITAAERSDWHILWFDYANPEESVDRVKSILKV